MPVPGAASFQVAPGPAETPAGKAPFVIGVGCWRPGPAAPAWALAHQVAGLAPPARLGVRPPRPPWLAVTLLPALWTQPVVDVGRLGDLERCLFWALALADGPAADESGTTS